MRRIDRYERLIDNIQECISGVLASKYKAHTHIIDDLTECLTETISPQDMLDIAHDLIAVNTESIDTKDANNILTAFNESDINITGLSIVKEIEENTKNERDKLNTFTYICHVISNSLSIEDFSLFYTCVQTNLMYRLNEMGENPYDTF